MELCEYERIHKLQMDGWWFGNGRNKIVIDILKRSVADFCGSRLLDVGCSEGAFLDYLNQNKINFTAIDSDQNAINFCKERGYGNRVKYGNILNLEFPDNSFDIVTALDVIEHIKDDVVALSEIKRVCKKNGIIFLILPAHQWLWSSNDIAYHHWRRYSKKMVKELIHKLDLEIITLTYFNILLFPVFILTTFVKKVFFPNKIWSNVLMAVPKLVNCLLSKIMDFERTLIKLGTAPFGSSFIIVAKNKRVVKNLNYCKN